MNEQKRELDLMVAELEQENRLLRARNERLEREALAQPVQKPVGVVYKSKNGDTCAGVIHDPIAVKDGDKIYTTPPAQPEMTVVDSADWVPCTPEWINQGGDCAKSPRVWNAKECNHYHPATPASRTADG